MATSAWMSMSIPMASQLQLEILPIEIHNQQAEPIRPDQMIGEHILFSGSMSNVHPCPPLGATPGESREPNTVKF